MVAGLSAAATSTSRRDSGQEPKRAEGGKAAQTTPRSTSSGGVVKSPQSGVDKTSYWTPERMKDAQPLEKTVPSGSPSSSSTPSGGSAPAGAAPVKSAPTSKSAPAKNKSSAGEEGAEPQAFPSSEPILVA